MRIQCDVCERQLARVLCCNDEAALCHECDAAVHAANKLANKHQRVGILQGQDKAHLANETPVCDICQEKLAFFFCMEDRAVLCRDCDVAIHLPNTLSAHHRRFLFSNIRVSLEPETDPSPSPEPAGIAGAAGGVPGSSSLGQMKSSGRIQLDNSSAGNTQKLKGGVSADGGSSRTMGKTKAGVGQSGASGGSAQGGPALGPGVSMGGMSESWGALLSGTSLGQGVGGVGSEALGAHTLAFARGSLSGGLGQGHGRNRSESLSELENVPGWRIDELLNIPDLAEGYSLADVGSSKAEMGNLGDFDWTADLSLFDEQVYAESLHEVPQLSSPVPVLGGPSFDSLTPAMGAQGAPGGSSSLAGPGATVGGLGPSARSSGSGSAQRLFAGSGGRGRSSVQDPDDGFVVPDLSAPSKRRKAQN